jgi:GNAT superfamily N-acetyltransferase
MLALRRLGLRTLDLEIPTARGVTVRILERPGLWMESAARRALLAELRDLAALCSDLPLEYGLLGGEEDRWNRAVLTLIRDQDTGRLVGFNAMPLLDVIVGGRPSEVLHLGLLVLDPAWRGRGFSRLVYGLSVALLLLRRRGRSFWVSSVSQVPAIVGMVARSLEVTYPGSERAPTDVHRALAKEIMARHREAFGVGAEAGFDADRFVIENAYTGGSDGLKKSYADAPKHRDGVFNELCRSALDYERGDDFLQVGRFTPRVALRCLKAFLLRNSVLAPAFARLPGGRRAWRPATRSARGAA